MYVTISAVTVLQATCTLPVGESSHGGRPPDAKTSLTAPRLSQHVAFVVVVVVVVAVGSITGPSAGAATTAAAAAAAAAGGVGGLGGR